MDPRRVLGVDELASPSRIQRAHRRLAEQAVARASGPDSINGLLQFLARTRDDAMAGRPTRAPDPHHLLGLAPGADRDAIKAAWRRLAPLAHPDSGGTDELFRVLSNAHDELTGAGLRRYILRERWQPPPRPPPPGPFQAPAPADRIRQSARQSWLDLVANSCVALTVVWVPAAALTIDAALLVPLLFAVPLFYLRFGRSALFNAARAAVRLRAGRRTITDSEAPDLFLAERALDAPVGREWDDRVYETYVLWCRRRGGHPLPPWAFIEELRSYGLLHVKAPGWDHGLWVGIRLTAAEAGGRRTA